MITVNGVCGGFGWAVTVRNQPANPTSSRHRQDARTAWPDSLAKIGCRFLGTCEGANDMPRSPHPNHDRLLELLAERALVGLDADQPREL
jgi:hypothetical protein